MLARKSLYAFSSEDPTAFGRHIAAASQEHAVYFDEGLGLPVVLRGADVIAAMKDPATFSNRVYDQGLMKGALVALEGEAHARMRRLYNSFFAPRALARYEAQIVSPAVDQVLDELAKKERADLIDDFATAMPIAVISALFGLPAANIHANDALVKRMLLSIVRPYDEPIMADAWKAYHELEGQMREISAREIAEPSDTLLGEVARALIAEGMGTVDDCERVVLTLILGSYETTIWMLASVLAALLANPEAMRQVRAEPALIPGAIDEATRWCGTSLGVVRFVEKDATLAGTPFTAGSAVFLSLTGAHYEAANYPDPHVYDVKRRATALIFGMGPHYCVGAPLARMEARIGVGRLLARFPNLRADPERRPVFSTGPRGAATFGPDSLMALLT